MNQRKTKQARRAAREASQTDDVKRTTRRRVLIGAAVVVLVAALVAGVFVARGNGPARAVAVHRSGKALALSGSDPVTSKHVDLAAFRGKPIVLNVWGSWCTECNAEAADLARFAQTHPNAQVVGLDIEDTSSGAKAFYRRWNWHHPSIADPKGAVAAALGVEGFPTTFFLNARHEIVTSIVGASNLAGFERGLRLALRGTS